MRYREIVLSTKSNMSEQRDFYIVSLDVGSSSVRTLLFDAEARQVEGYGARLPYEPDRTPDGGVEVDPEKLAGLAIDCFDELHRQIHADGLRIAAVASDAFWHSFLGVDDHGRPTVPILHLLDTRADSEVSRVPDTHRRTGCVPHSSYWPAKLLWLAKNKSAGFAATKRWLSFPEFLFEKIFGQPRVSTSMISATGLWDQNKNDYDAETLAASGITRDQLPDPAGFDQPARDLLPEFARLWPSFNNVPWFPALGDGACDNLGSGCITPDRFSLMVGTTGAMRVVLEADHVDIPDGLWCYRVDKKRFVIGGALSNGGDVFAWMKRTLVLPKDLEARLDSADPGTHGLTMLPFFSGERSPYWRSDLRAAITGLSFSTGPFDIFRAALESVSLRFREIDDLLAARIGPPKEVIASGGGLLKSPAWTQMMADALGRSLTQCTEPEATCRGAALWALEQIGAIGHLNALPASMGATFDPRLEHRAAYDRLLRDQHQLLAKLYP